MKKRILLTGISFTLLFTTANAQSTGSATASTNATKTKYVSTNPGKASPSIKAAPAKKQPKRVHITVPANKQGQAVKK